MSTAFPCKDSVLKNVLLVFRCHHPRAQTAFYSMADLLIIYCGSTADSGHDGVDHQQSGHTWLRSRRAGDGRQHRRSAERNAFTPRAVINRRKLVIFMRRYPLCWQRDCCLGWCDPSRRHPTEAFWQAQTPSDLRHNLASLHIRRTTSLA